MSKKATLVRNEERRTSAELTDDGVIPPQVYVLADEGAHGDAISAVATAVGENPNAVDAPRVTNRDDGEWGELNVHFRANEMPVVGEGGSVTGWLAPYRAEERFRESLLEHLPSGYTLETQKRGHFVLAQE